MPTPRAEHWRPIGAAGPWRPAATDPPPDPPEEVEWLERPAGMLDGEYRRHVEMGRPATFTGAQLP